MVIELVLSFPCQSCLPPGVSTARQLLAGSVSHFQPQFFSASISFSFPFFPLVSQFTPPCTPPLHSPLAEMEEALCLVYFAVKSSCSVCAKGLPVFSFFWRRASQLTWWIKVRQRDMRGEDALFWFFFFCFLAEEIHSVGTSKAKEINKWLYKEFLKTMKRSWWNCPGLLLFVKDIAKENKGLSL